MALYYGFQGISSSDLTMYQYGTQDCEPGHNFGPAVRDHYLIHYIFKGKGIFCVGNKTYHLQKGQGFLIHPGIITYYQADKDDPWSYSWVGFKGTKAEALLRNANLSMESPIFNHSKVNTVKECIDNMLFANEYEKAREIRILGFLYVFLSEIIEENGNEKSIEQSGDRKEQYLRKAIEFMEMNYSRKISINDIARHTGLDRSYLGSIFKQQLDTSPQHYLMNLRMNKACEYMKDENLSIGDISRSVGYEDPLLFSKIFKKFKGQPPREFRKLNMEKPKDTPQQNPVRKTYSCM